MNKTDPTFFHKLYGERHPRLAYVRTDFVDYDIMTTICGMVIWLVYGPTNPLSFVGIALVVWMKLTFTLRHGLALRIPLLLRRPQDVLYMILYKLQNIKPSYYLAVAALVVQCWAIRLTPTLPHHTALMRDIALWLFYAHLGVLTVYRTAILISHLRHRDRVQDFLLETTWKTVVSGRRSVTLEIWHAYFTGLLTHLLLVTPWYIMITHVQYSLVFLPVMIVASLLVQGQVGKFTNEWFYRDHWLGHNSELEFIYLHGPHHDAIPSGLIGVAGTGFLEGFARHTLGGSGIFYSPLVTALQYTLEVQTDIEGHQFIPGVYPRVPLSQVEVNQHSRHHFLKLEPYGLGLNVDRPEVPAAVRRKFRMLPSALQAATKLDEQLNGFKWDNAEHKKFLHLFEKHQPADSAEAESRPA